MNLYIDTTSGEYIYIALASKNKILGQKKLKAQYKQAEKLLPAIDDLLKKVIKDKRSKHSSGSAWSAKSNVKVQSTLDLKSKISGIVVVNGPGPFTATRIGIATANALAYSWKTPIIGIKNTEFDNKEELIELGARKLLKARKGNVVEPFYDKEPHITIKKII